MLDGFFMLLLLCIVMAIASILAGLLPLSFALSQRQLRFITALGTGVLVGTSLIVIIPEGIETVYSASGSSHGHNKRDLSLVMSRRHAYNTGPVADVAWTSILKREDSMGGFENSIIARAQGDFVTGPDDGFRTEEEIAADLAKPGHPSTDAGHEAQSSVPPSEQKVPSYHDDEPAGHDPHAYVGISLIAGFILMYLIDTLPRRASSSSQPQRFQINLTQFSLNRASTSSPDLESPQQDGDYHATSNSASSSRPSSTTVGLVIHACADGIALGASSTSGSSSSGRNLSLIIFLALMIHKAPAAFGLTTTLLKQGLSKRAARAHLVVFSLAAPAGALLTWAAASLLGYGGPESMSAEFATGVLLLFSGGTFLYVAMHTMQEGAGHTQHAGNGYAEVPMNGYGESGSGGGAQGKDAGEHGVAETFVTVVGMLLPLLTQFGHAH